MIAATAMLVVPGVGAREAVELVPVATGLSPTVLVTNAGDGSNRLFLVGRRGRLRILAAGELLEEPFLDLSDRVGCCDGESGLLGLAFHPRYARNGRFYVSYTDEVGDSVVSRFRVSAADPNRADPGSEQVLLLIPQPAPSHNVGHLAFGPDGYLYVGAGDGGCCGDPEGNAQDVGSLLGKILRIDVDGAEPYAVPPDNPFVDDPEARPEIWALGLRNPWRFGFDRLTGDLFVGDVGQDAFEEVDHEPAGSGGGRNYGWPVTEGSACFDPPEDCDREGLTPPILEYAHQHGHDDDPAPGCAAVIGGYRYRGPRRPTLPRFYLFGDLCSGQIWGARQNLAGTWKAVELAHTDLNVFSFGEDEAGRLYVVESGGVYRLRGRSTFGDRFESGRTRNWSRRRGRGRLRVVQPGLAGSGHALQVRIDGTARPRFLRSDEPDGLTSFRAAFVLSVNGVELGGPGGGAVEILSLNGADGKAHVWLTLLQDGGRYFVLLFARDAPESEAEAPGGTWRSVGRVRVPARREVALELDWLQASRPEVADGTVRLLRNGRVRLVAGDLRNGELTVDSVALGLPAGSAGAVGGSFLIDEYTSSP